MTSPPSYQVVIDLLNKFKKYYNQLLVAGPQFEHRVPCTVQFHGLQVFTPQTRETLLDELHHVEGDVKKIVMPKSLQDVLVRKLKVFSAQLTRGKDAVEYPDLFVSTVCVPLKEELISIYRHDIEKVKWIIAGFAIFEKA
ncbi:MAG: hypothetical protein HY363_00190 [Candidatus Aenigmarchaeota archaeon]|nr:hypothetical protein [Candidatus Aenigmarchaeota archaeon]